MRDVGGDRHYRVLPRGHFLGVLEKKLSAPTGEVSLIRRPPDSRVTIEAHEHHGAHIILIIEGVYKTAAQSGAPVHAGSVIVNPPGTRHDDQFVGAGSLVAFSPCDDLWEISKRGIREPTPHLVSVAHAASLLSAISQEAALSDETSTLSIEALSLELAAALSGVECDARRRPDWLERARARINEAGQEWPDMASLAQDVGVHPVHLARTFRRFFGAPPGAYLRLARAKRAARLLAKSSASIVEVAHECGFADQAAFTKAFVRATGMPPGVFRRRWVS